MRLRSLPGHQAESLHGSLSTLLLGILGEESVPSDMVPMEGISPINILLNRVPQTFIFSLDVIYQGIRDSFPLMIC